MRAAPLAVVGTLCLFVAGFIRGGEASSPDPELVFGFSYALGGLGLMGVLAAGVAVGVRLGPRLINALTCRRPLDRHGPLPQ